MRDFLRFLGEHKLWWITPIVVVTAALVLLAWKVARSPANPFVYEF